MANQVIEGVIAAVALAGCNRKPSASGYPAETEIASRYGDWDLAARGRADLNRFGNVIFREGDQTWHVIVEPSIQQAEHLAAQVQHQPGGAFVVPLNAPQ